MITLGANIAALRTLRYLDDAGRLTSTAVTRLSSGLRINTPSDDAVSLGIASMLQLDARLATVAMRNVSDGISTLSIQDSVLSEASSILTRMTELAVQSANGSIGTTQRSALQLEFTALGSELDRIATTTKFNGLPLLNGTTPIDLQIGFESFSTSQLHLDQISTKLDSLGLAVSNTAALAYSISGSNALQAQAAAVTALEAVRKALDAVDTKRGYVGAAENRLQIAVDHLQVQRENYAAAADRITNADIATETATAVRGRILTDVATAVLAHALQGNQLVLNLITESLNIGGTSSTSRK